MAVAVHEMNFNRILEGTESRVSIICSKRPQANDPRDGPQPAGLVIEHKVLEQYRESKSVSSEKRGVSSEHKAPTVYAPEAWLERSGQLTDASHDLDYSDPMASVSKDYAGSWLAGLAPVRPLYASRDQCRTGWLVVVQERP